MRKPEARWPSHSWILAFVRTVRIRTELATTVGGRREREAQLVESDAAACCRTIVHSPVLQERSGTASSGWIALRLEPATFRRRPPFTLRRRTDVGRFGVRREEEEEEEEEGWPR